ncbi:MAG: hypothetical protein P8P30_01945 [Rickettsiales bacterium]|nr:hypothetical protein [Rickettsiales bacterium]
MSDRLFEKYDAYRLQWSNRNPLNPHEGHFGLTKGYDIPKVVKDEMERRKKERLQFEEEARIILNYDCDQLDK